MRHFIKVMQFIHYAFVLFLCSIAALFLVHKQNTGINTNAAATSATNKQTDACIGVTPSTWTQACLVQLSAPCPIQQKRLQSEPNYAEMVVDQANTMRQPVETQRLGQIALRAQGDC